MNHTTRARKSSPSRRAAKPKATPKPAPDAFDTAYKAIQVEIASLPSGSHASALSAIEGVLFALADDHLDPKSGLVPERDEVRGLVAKLVEASTQGLRDLAGGMGAAREHDALEVTREALLAANHATEEGSPACDLTGALYQLSGGVRVEDRAAAAEVIREALAALGKLTAPKPDDDLASVTNLLANAYAELAAALEPLADLIIWEKADTMSVGYALEYVRGAMVDLEDVYNRLTAGESNVRINCGKPAERKIALRVAKRDMAVTS